MTTRNAANTLGDAVRAVLAQDLDGEIELVVADNASTDATAALMRELVAGAARPVAYLRLPDDRGPAGGRNAALELARGRFIAFTDSDCVPAPRWLRAAVAAFDDPAIGIVQGRTEPANERVRLFEHHISIRRFDGSFATANVVYRREALGDERFDPQCWYWEDVDLGWRVTARGWEATYVAGALVRHAIVSLTPVRWMLWTRRYATIPAIVRRYPGYRAHLFRHVWVRPAHALVDLAGAGLIAALWWPPAGLLAIPYAVWSLRTHGWNGRFPPAKLAAYAVRDAVGCVTLLASSARHRTLVL